MAKIKIYKGRYELWGDQYEFVRPAESKAKLLDEYGGNGVIPSSIKDITSEGKVIDLTELYNALITHMDVDTANIVMKCVQCNYPNVIN